MHKFGRKTAYKVVCNFIDRNTKFWKVLGKIVI